MELALQSIFDSHYYFPSHSGLEELETDGDSVHCPVCLCRWETLPLDCPLQTVSELTRSSCPCTETNSSIVTVGSRNVDNHVVPTQMGCDGQAVTSTEFTSSPGTDSRELIGSTDPRLGIPATTALNPPSAFVGRTGLPQSPFPDYRLCVAAFTLEVRLPLFLTFLLWHIVLYLRGYR